ncbi:helix-turn-helix domain-containing protein [Aquabacterium sp.]|uniref:helix-turn-helix domain-containing protein n=1 Tax=Aquabacterium sp. TaxID=1872578 RepID=UPI003D6D38F1
MLRTLQSVHFPVQYLEITESLVKARGGRVAEVRERCGLPPQGSRDVPQPTMIDGHQLQTSMRIGLDHCLPGRPASLQVLEHFPLTAHGMLGMLTIASQTVGEALDMALQYHALVMPVFSLSRQPGPQNSAVVKFEQVVDFTPFNELLAELVVGTFRTVAPYTSLAQPVMGVCFKHAAPPSEQWPEYEAFFGMPVRFDAPYQGFTVSHDSLQSPLITGNRATRDSLEAMLHKQAPQGVRLTPLTQRVRQAVGTGLQRGALVQAAHIAHELALSPRSLSRHLQDEGTTLTEIIETLRIEHAEQLLTSSARPVQEIARLVGYADASSFSRAFKRATGRTPAEVRERTGGLAR